MTTPPDPAPAAPVDERVTRIEREQERQGGLLDRLVTMIEAGNSDTTVTRADPPPATAAADMTAQMEQAIRNVNAEAAGPKDTAPPPETTPREVMIKGKEKLQRALFGGDKR